MIINRLRITIQNLSFNQTKQGSSSCKTTHFALLNGFFYKLNPMQKQNGFNALPETNTWILRLVMNFYSGTLSTHRAPF